MDNTMHALKRNQVSFLLISLFLLSCFCSIAQAPQEVFARVSMMKVSPGNQKEFEKFMNEKIKPLHMLRRQQGKIFLWILFKVHNVGGNDEYNYVGVSYHPAWETTEPPLFADLIRQAHPEDDAVAIESKWRELGTLVRQHILFRMEAIEPNPPVPSKYVRLDYMRVRPGKNGDYLDVEMKEWMPVHQSLINDGQCTGWGLWQLVFPGGSESAYHYVTSQRYADYAHALGTGFEEVLRKTHPSRNVSEILTRTTESRDLVKSELWEVVDMLQ